MIIARNEDNLSLRRLSFCRGGGTLSILHQRNDESWKRVHPADSLQARIPSFQLRGSQVKSEYIF